MNKISDLQDSALQFQAPSCLKINRAFWVTNLYSWLYILFCADLGYYLVGIWNYFRSPNAFWFAVPHWAN